MAILRELSSSHLKIWNSLYYPGLSVFERGSRTGESFGSLDKDLGSPGVPRTAAAISVSVVFHEHGHCTIGHKDKEKEC